MGKLNFPGRERIHKQFKVKVKDGKREMFSTIYLPVWQTRYSVNANDVDRNSFEWPEFTTDSKRIKATSKKYAEKSIPEAFADNYGIAVNLNEMAATKANLTPTDVKAGDLIDVNITHVDKNNVILECMNLKQTITSCVNLWKYTNFKKFLPKDPVKAKVITSTPAKVVVDPISPMFDSWLNGILQNPDTQKMMGYPQTVTVKNLHLTNGGFVGRAAIPTLSEYLGDEYTVEAFIPGSQIVLNIEDDFSKWEGKTVQAFVTAYIPKPNNLNQMSLICSVKEYLKFEGDSNLIGIFGGWCDGGDEWKEIAAQEWQGEVTGVINTSKKCGVFVEMPSLNITGFVPMPPAELVNYKPHMQLPVKIKGIEEPTYYDDASKQMKHDDPYVINEDGYLEKCSIKALLQFA